ncbi:hypothetical protein EDF68_1339 [Ochrobactrum sp. BH3]|nr:hypothetical protein EDF68_1339 [Ochrobactrum sp. BH3]
MRYERDEAVMSHELHDPGGKVRLKVKSEIRGDALFSECGRYRRLLTRDWDGAEKAGYVLWIGMNPSTAAFNVDDPTVFKEQKFTRRWGYGRYVKCNVMDYRATNPKMLLEQGVIPCTQENLQTIVEQALGAEIVVMAYGSLHKKLAHHGQAVTDALRAAKVKLHALKITNNGSPGHPLYLKDTSELIPY